MTKARELFADEQAYLAHLRNLAEMERRERLAANAAKPTPKEQAERKRRDAYVRRLLVIRPYQRKWRRKWRAANPERNRETYRAWRARHREQYRLYQAAYYRDHREEKRLYLAAYRSDHREELRAQDRAYYRKMHPSCRSKAEVEERAREFETRIVALRSENWTWGEIVELTGKSAGGCQKAYYRAMKRQQREDGAA